MKRLLALLCISALLWSCQEADQQSDKKAQGSEEAGKNEGLFTTIEWIDSTTQDLGKIKEGQVLEVAYRFRNSGNKNLIIEDVRASCGCTVPEKPEKPLAPGEEGVIKAKFDSKGRVGPQSKTVTVVANAIPIREFYLQFKVEVEASK